MNRRALLLAAGAWTIGAGRVAAQTAERQVIRQLQDQGFRNIRVQRTWLGRVRIVAESRLGRREIVLDPSTGAILRDYLDRDRRLRTERDGGSRARDGRAADRGEDRDDDDRDDDRDDRDREDRDDSGRGRGRGRGGRDRDRDDDDNSGRGSGNSGSGGGGDDDDDD